jgi:hypothetical protein
MNYSAIMNDELNNAIEDNKKSNKLIAKAFAAIFIITLIFGLLYNKQSKEQAWLEKQQLMAEGKVDYFEPRPETLLDRQLRLLPNIKSAFYTNKALMPKDLFSVKHTDIRRYITMVKVFNKSNLINKSVPVAIQKILASAALTEEGLLYFTVNSCETEVTTTEFNCDDGLVEYQLVKTASNSDG